MVAGHDERACRASVLVWNSAGAAMEAVVNLRNLPFDSVRIEQWRLDDFHPLRVS